MLVITVDIELREGAAAAFMPLISENARLSLAEEPGCHHFDVCVGEDDPRRIFLYEIYDDAAAFEAHLASPHFAAFDAASADMVAAKQVRRYRLA